MSFKKIAGAIAMAGALVATGAVPGQAATLDDVKAAGTLKCGINTGLPGFAYTDDAGNWTGFDVAYCRALAAAVLGDANAISFVNLTGKTRFPALASGEIDVLSRNTTWTLSRDVDLGFTFIGVSYYDGQGFIGRTALGIGSATELDGASVCIQTGTTTELNLADFFRVNGNESPTSRCRSRPTPRPARPTRRSVATFIRLTPPVSRRHGPPSTIRASTWCSRRSSRRSRWGRWCATATTSGRISRAGR